MKRLCIIALLAIAGCATKQNVPAPLAKRIEPPKLPQFSAVAAPAPVAYRFALTWPAQPSGVSNYVTSGASPQSLTVTQQVGATNFFVVTQTNKVGYYQVIPMRGRDVPTPSNIVSYPGKKIRQMRHATYSGNQVLSDIVLLTFTNTPPGTHAQTYWKEWDDYSP